MLALYYRKPLRAAVAPLEDVDPKSLLIDRCASAHVQHAFELASTGLIAAAHFLDTAPSLH